VTLLRPRWVAGHLLVLVLTVSFLALGFWQLARNSHKQQLVREERAAFAAPAPDVATLQPAGSRVQASGRYDPAHEVLLSNQVHNGQDGADVLTPLVRADGSAVIVDRGWVSEGVVEGSDAIATATGPVVVRGLAHASTPLNAQDTVITSGGRLIVPKVDLDRIGQDVPHDLQPQWIEAQAQAPAPGPGAPLLPEPPAPDQVNHLEYAIEWFSFAAIGIIGWPVALMAFARRRGGFSTPDRGDEGDDRKN